MHELTPTPGGAAVAVSAALADTVRQILAAADAENTRRAYAADWRAFVAWCTTDQNLETLPASPETIGLYLAAHADTLKPSTLERRVAGIGWVHRQAGLTFDARAREISQVLKGVRRTKGTAPAQKTPLLTDDILSLLRYTDESPRGLQERALVLVGYAAALRRSELVGIDMAHIAWKRDGIEVTIPRSKTDQVGAGQVVGIVYGEREWSCPVRALKRWLGHLEAQGVVAGPVFRSMTRGHRLTGGRLSAEAVADAVKRLARRAGLDPARYAGHSLRSGHVTQGKENNVEDSRLMDQTRHRSVDTLRGYDRKRNRLRNSSSGKLGL